MDGKTGREYRLDRFGDDVADIVTYNIRVEERMGSGRVEMRDVWRIEFELGLYVDK